MALASGNAFVLRSATRPYTEGKRRAEAVVRCARRDALVIDHLPLVRAIAHRIREKLPQYVELEDLIHAGILGLIDAAGKYLTDKRVEFSCYARHRIRGAIMDSLRQLDFASRDLRQCDKALQAACRELSTEIQRLPTHEELAEKIGMGIERCRQVLSDLQSCKLVSAGVPEGRMAEFPGSPDTHPDRMFAGRQRRAKLAGVMSALPERYKRVLALYYDADMTMKQIGLLLGINESRVCQIHRVALEKMQGLLRAAGVHSSGDL